MLPNELVNINDKALIPKRSQLKAPDLDVRLLHYCGKTGSWKEIYVICLESRIIPHNLHKRIKSHF